MSFRFANAAVAVALTAIIVASATSVTTRANASTAVPEPTKVCTDTCDVPPDGCLTVAAYRQIVPGTRGGRVQDLAGGGPASVGEYTTESGTTLEAFSVCHSPGFVLVRTHEDRAGTRRVTGKRIVRSEQANKPPSVALDNRVRKDGQDCFTAREFRSTTMGSTLARAQHRAQAVPLAIASGGGVSVRVYWACDSPGLVVLRSKQEGDRYVVSRKRSLVA